MDFLWYSYRDAVCIAPRYAILPSLRSGVSFQNRSFAKQARLPAPSSKKISREENYDMSLMPSTSHNLPRRAPVLLILAVAVVAGAFAVKGRNTASGGVNVAKNGRFENHRAIS